MKPAQASEVLASASTTATVMHSVSLPLLDTVRFHLDSRQVTLVWRAHFERSNPVAEISLAATTQEIVMATAPDSMQGASA